MEAINREELREFRRKKFNARIEKAPYNDADDYALMVTHNGQQWNGITLNRWEMQQVIKLLVKVAL